MATLYEYHVEIGEYGGDPETAIFRFEAQSDETAAFKALKWFGNGMTWFHLFRNQEMIYHFNDTENPMDHQGRTEHFKLRG